MTGRIYQFGLTTLPSVTARWNMSAKAQNTVLRTLGGYYDTAGSDDAELDLSEPITVTAQAYANTQSALGQSLDTYRGLLRKRDRLWLDPWDTTATDRFCMARCIAVNELCEYNNRVLQPIELVFQPLTGWQGHVYGGAWNLDSGYLFDNGLWFDQAGATTTDADGDTLIVVPNAGNRTCTNVGITVTAATSNMTAVTFNIAGVAEFSWTGTVTHGNSLVIDCGARRVTATGVAAYSGFALGANHNTHHWLPLEPGNNTVRVQIANVWPLTPPLVQFTYGDCFV